MERLKIKEVLQRPEYDSIRNFIENDKRVSKVLFLCFGGSYSYGTNNASSDIDVRGVFIPSTDALLGFSSFDVYEDKKTDTVLYSLPKFIKLASDCNPNVLEMLFCNEDDYLFLSPEGKILYSNRNLFLTKRAYYTFGHYAFSQLSKIEEATSEEGKKIMLCETPEERIDDAILSLILKYDLNENDLKRNEDGTFDVCIKGYSFKQYRAFAENFVHDIERIGHLKELGSKNKKKEEKVDKHMMHLIRLYFMALEILTDNTLHTYRGNIDEHNLLMDIRNGKYRNESGQIIDSFYELVKNLKEKSDLAFKNSNLTLRVEQSEVFKLYASILKSWHNSQ